MAGKFVDLSEAAKMLGVSAEEVVEMRSKGDIFGYRDGASWKFKTEEVQRVIRERGVEGRPGGDSGILSANDEDFENLISGLSSKILAEKALEESESGSVLISEQELGVSATGQSTIIGKGGQPDQRAADSDLRLADSNVLGGSDKLIEAPGNKLDPASASDVLHGSDLNVATGSGTGDMPLPKPGSTGALKTNAELALGDDDEPSSDSALDEQIQPKKGSGVGSDVTLGSGDSGINLAPSDSGLSLEEEPLDLGGSGVDSLELPEDDEVIDIQSGAAGDADAGSQVKADNEFLLSAGDTLQDEDSDSGSQVIALEDSESFDQEAATMLKSEPGAALEEEAFQPIGVEPGLAVPAAGMAAPMYVGIPAAETPYSVWNVVSLGLVAGVLALSGMMMVDVILNMWVSTGTSSITTGVMDAVLSIIPG
jgi:excisionase family DNA binding protein